MKPNLDDNYYLLKALEKGDSQTQRALARQLGLSLGKINFILKALAAKGWVKMENFARSDNKMRYRYILTPEGIKGKVQTTRAFIARKEREYERISEEIKEAKREIDV